MAPKTSFFTKKIKQIRMNTLDLPDELVLLFLSFLPIPEITRSQRVCSLWNNILNDKSAQHVWKQLCSKCCSMIEISEDNGPLKLEITHWKRIARFLEMHKSHLSKERNLEESEEELVKQSLIYDAIEASSVDFPSQSLKETLHKTMNGRSSFWSSTGSIDSASSEWAIYRLRSSAFIEKFQCNEALISKNEEPQFELLLVSKLHVKPFKASWQGGNVYAPKNIMLSIGDSEHNFSLFSSDKFKMENVENFQAFAVGPALIIRKYSKPDMVQDTVGRENNITSEIDVMEDDEEEEEDVFDSNEDEEVEFGSEDYLSKLLRRCTQEEINEAIIVCNGVIDNFFFLYLDNIVKRKNETIRWQQMRKQHIEEIIRTNQLREEGNLFIKLDMLGKYQTQPTDDLYYTCLEYVDLCGTAALI
jgi:hypothetical protein